MLIFNIFWEKGSNHAKENDEDYLRVIELEIEPMDFENESGLYRSEEYDEEVQVVEIDAMSIENQ